MKVLFLCAALAMSACASEPQSDLSQATENLWALNGRIAADLAQERRHLVLGMLSGGILDYTVVETSGTEACEYVAEQFGHALSKPILDPALPRLDSVECVAEVPPEARPVSPIAWGM